MRLGLKMFRVWDWGFVSLGFGDYQGLGIRD